MPSIILDLVLLEVETFCAVIVVGELDVVGASDAAEYVGTQTFWHETVAKCKHKNQTTCRRRQILCGVETGRHFARRRRRVQRIERIER